VVIDIINVLRAVVKTEVRTRPPYHSRAEWIVLTEGSAWESSPQRSTDEKLAYYLSARDGYHCIWGQPLGAAKHYSIGIKGS